MPWNNTNNMIWVCPEIEEIHHICFTNIAVDGEFVIKHMKLEEIIDFMAQSWDLSCRSLNFLQLRSFVFPGSLERLHGL